MDVCLHLFCHCYIFIYILHTVYPKRLINKTSMVTSTIFCVQDNVCATIDSLPQNFSWTCANLLKCVSYVCWGFTSPAISCSAFILFIPDSRSPGGWFLLGGTMAARQLVAWWDDHQTPSAWFDAWICFNWRGWWEEVTNQPRDVWISIVGGLAYVSFSKLYINVYHQLHRIALFDFTVFRSIVAFQLQAVPIKGVHQNRCS